MRQWTSQAVLAESRLLCEMDEVTLNIMVPCFAGHGWLDWLILLVFGWLSSVCSSWFSYPTSLYWLLSGCPSGAILVTVTQGRSHHRAPHNYLSQTKDLSQTPFAWSTQTNVGRYAHKHATESRQSHEKRVSCITSDDGTSSSDECRLSATTHQPKINCSSNPTQHFSPISQYLLACSAVSSDACRFQPPPNTTWQGRLPSKPAKTARQQSRVCLCTARLC